MEKRSKVDKTACACLLCDFMPEAVGLSATDVAGTSILALFAELESLRYHAVLKEEVGRTGLRSGISATLSVRERVCLASMTAAIEAGQSMHGERASSTASLSDHVLLLIM
jgi:predicted benzoate:H+ symporter BenE